MLHFYLKIQACVYNFHYHLAQNYTDNIYIFQKIKNLVPNKITLCYTGQFSKEKGIGNFFEAIDRLRKKISQWKFLCFFSKNVMRTQKSSI